MTRPDTLPDLTHRWQDRLGPDGRLPMCAVLRWKCSDCDAASAVPTREPCDERTLAWGRQQHAAGYREGVRDAFTGKVAMGAYEADPTGPLIVVPVDRMDEAAGYPLSRDPSQSESQPTPVRRPSRRTGSPAGGAPLSPDTDRNPDDKDETP